MQETQVWSLGWEDSLEKDVDGNTDSLFTKSSYLPCAIWPSTSRINSTDWLLFRDERSETRRGKQRFRHQQLFNIRVGFQNQFFQLPVQCSFLLINNAWSLSFLPLTQLLPSPAHPLPSLSTPVPLPFILPLYFLSPSFPFLLSIPLGEDCLSC